jgi:uracil-DNA glycosylase family 4
LERRHPLAECESCPLNTPETAFVPTKPSREADARLVVVGEAPGFYETTKGEPFSGPSGQLLNKVLNHYGYARDEVMLTNVCLCRPKDNATPTKTAIAACRPRLLHELRTSGAADVLALGGTAASALIDDARTITNLRVGPAKSPTAALGSDSPIERVVPTWHPAYCLRNADAFPALVGDVAKLRSTNTDAWTPPRWKYFDDPVEARRVITEIRNRFSEIVVDIEVGIEKDFAFGHPNEYDLLCVGLGYERGTAVVIGTTALSDKGVIDSLRELLQNVRIIAHNGKFDLAGLYPTLGNLQLWFDTMLASYCLDERPGNHGLKVLAVEKLGAPQYDLEIQQYVPKKGNYANIPRGLLYKYNAYDVACTWELYELFKPQLETTYTPQEWPYDWLAPKSLRDVHDFMVAASNQLMYLELNGITIDRVHQNELRGIFSGRLDRIEADLDNIVWESTAEGREEAEALSGQKAGINPRSPKQVKEYLESQGIRTDTTNEDTLTGILERSSPTPTVARFIRTLLIHRRQQKLYSTYVDGIRKRIYRGRVYTTYLLHGTTSGRLASRNPNLQNIVRDKDIRRQFSVSKPDNVLIQCDYRNAELRVIATLARDEYLRDLLSNPDPKYKFFNELSDQLYGKDNWTKEDYIRTKAFVYGIGYGREPYSIGLEFNMSVAEANRRYNEFMDLIPATAQWQMDVRKRVLSGADLVTPFGRRRRFWLITEQNKKEVFNEALSYLPQSTASDICVAALTDLRPMLRGLGFIRLTIHDAIVTECHESRADQVGAMMQEVMLAKGKEFTDYVPFPTDISIGKTWGDL